MKKYLHYTAFAVNANCILTDTYDESKRGYTLYAEIEAENLPVILEHLQQVYGFTVKGENIGTSAYNLVEFIRGLTDDESAICEPFRIVRYLKDRKTELCFREVTDERKIDGKYLIVVNIGTDEHPITELVIREDSDFSAVSGKVQAVFKSPICEKAIERVFDLQQESTPHLVISETRHRECPRSISAWVLSFLKRTKIENGIDFAVISASISRWRL